MGFLEVLTLLFVGLKLLGVIGWSWWLVLAPLWGSLLVILSFFITFVTAVVREVSK